MVNNKTIKVAEKLPEFPNKSRVVNKMVEMETLSEELAYGTQKNTKEIEKCIELFKELENIINPLVDDSYEKK